MANTNITESKLKSLFRETLKEVFSLEFMKLRASLLPFVSNEEQKEIERKYKKPERKVAKSVELKL